MGKLINYVQSLKTVLEPSQSYVILSLQEPSTRELRCRWLLQNKRSIVLPPFAAPKVKKTHVLPTSKKFRGSRKSSKKAASCRCENEPNKPLWGLKLWLTNIVMFFDNFFKPIHLRNSALHTLWDECHYCVRTRDSSYPS